MTSAFTPLPREALEPDAAALYDAILETRGSTAALIGLIGPDGSMRGPFGPLLHSPPVGNVVQRLGTSLKAGTGLSATVFEVVALTVAHERDCEFERNAHTLLGVRSGALTEEDVARITDGRAPAAADAAAAWDFARRQCRREAVDIAAALTAFGERGVVELTVLSGYYELIAMILRTCSPSDAAPDGQAK